VVLCGGLSRCPRRIRPGQRIDLEVRQGNAIRAEPAPVERPALLHTGESESVDRARCQDRQVARGTGPAAECEELLFVARRRGRPRIPHGAGWDDTGVQGRGQAGADRNQQARSSDRRVAGTGRRTVVPALAVARVLHGRQIRRVVGSPAERRTCLLGQDKGYYPHLPPRPVLPAPTLSDALSRAFMTRPVRLAALVLGSAVLT